MKKNVLILLAVMLWGVPKAFAYDFSAVAPSGQTLYYNILNSNEVSVTYPAYLSYYEAAANNYSGFSKPTGHLTIPDSVTYNGTLYSVTSIYKCAFYNCSGLTSVTIPNSVTSIGYSTFSGCSSLNSVTIPNSVTSIGTGTFSGCSSLSSVTIPNSVTSIGTGTFSDCSSLTSVTIPNSVTSIGNYAFSGCSSLNSVTIGNSVTSIGGQAFLNCSSLTSVTIPNSVTSIGEWAFIHCTSLSSVTIGNSVTSIGEYAFSGCSSLTSLTIPNSVTSIGDEAFSGCSSLNSVTIGNSVTSIGEWAFARCSSLKSVTIPSSVTTIGDNAFLEVRHIVYYGDATGSPWGAYFMNGYSEGDFVYSDNTKTNLLTYIGTGSNVTIPNSVTSIGNSAFSYCSRLTSVTIPNSVTSIGNSAFSYCSRLTSVTIPNSVTFIGGDAFYRVKHIEYNGGATGSPWGALSMNGYSEDDFVYLDNTKTNLLAYIGTGSNVTIPNSVISIGNYAFNNCDSITSVTIGNSVTSIGVWAFSGCSNLSSVTIPNSVISIGNYAFNNCDSITSVTIGNSVTSIGVWAFSGCSSLSSVTIPNSVTSIGTGTFSRCSSLSSVTIPNSVTSIGDNAFSGCSSLSLVTIPNSVTSIGNYAFSGCSSLTSVTIPNSVTSIGDNAFFGCSSLTSVTIPNSVTSIGEWAFCNCSSLTSVTIPSSVDSMGNYAFLGCQGPFYCRSSVPPTIVDYTNTFGTDKIVYVHCESVDAYRNALGWNSGSSYIHGYPFVIYGFETNNEVYGTVNSNTLNYSCDSIVVTVTAAPNNGYHLTGWSDGETSNVRTLYITHDTIVIAIFEKNSYDILTGSNDSSRGNVTHTGSNLYLDTSVVFATPNYGYHFTSWSDGETANPRTLIITQDTSFTAIFDKNAYSLLLASNSSVFGSVSDGGVFEYLDNLTFTATPYYGYHFTHWSDGNTSNPRTITLTQDTSFTAYFEKNSYSVVVFSDNSTMGQASGGDTVLYLDSVTISATSNYGYHFSHWQDNNADNPRTVQVTQNKTYTAYFDYNQYTISLDVDTTIHGTTSGAGIFNYLTPATISASANYGYHFTSWSDGNTDNPRTISLTQDTSFTAYFEKNSYAVTVLSNNDTMGQAAGGDTVLYLDSITISASANYGYHFTHWQDNNTDNPRTVQVTQNKTYTAFFDYNQYTISLGVDTTIHGTTSGAGIFNYLTPATISASANYGYHFTSWSDGNTDNPRTISLTQDTSFTAYFEKNSYAVTVLSNNNTMGQAAGGDTVLYLDSITISASANYGYHFTHWQDNNTDNPRTVQVTQNKTYTAYFDYDQFTLTVQSDNTTQGNVSGSGNYNYLSNRTITATPTYGHHFTYWNDGVTGNPRTITLTQDTSFTAHFAPNQYTLTVNASEHGTASGSGTYNFGDTISIQATPEDHYHFTRWNDGNRENPRYIRIEEDKTLTAFFAIDTHTVSVTTSDIVRGQVEASGTEFVYGTPCTVTATAYTGYVFAGWSNGVTANPYTFAVISDVELTAIFDSVTVGITDIDANDVSIHVAGGRILVMGAEGMEMRVFDIVGREVVSPTQSGESPVLPRGVYLVKVGTLPAKKVVVM